jgi:hypothetical protein
MFLEAFSKNLHFRQWRGAETPCELKERLKVTTPLTEGA